MFGALSVGATLVVAPLCPKPSCAAGQGGHKGRPYDEPAIHSRTLPYWPLPPAAGRGGGGTIAIGTLANAT